MNLSGWASYQTAHPGPPTDLPLDVCNNSISYRSQQNKSHICALTALSIIIICCVRFKLTKMLWGGNVWYLQKLQHV